MLPAHTQFIRNASTMKSEPPRKIMDGIIQGSLNPFQRTAVAGLLHSGMPEHQSPAPAQGHAPLLKKSKGKDATPLKDGFMPYPGAPASRGRK